MKIDKRELILENIIRAYLKQNEPVGSSVLCEHIIEQGNANIPASTIRVYFKKLSDEGAITKLHISGGRIPTVLTMSYYWQEHLKFNEKIKVVNEELLSFLVYELGIYCMIFAKKNPKFSAIKRISDKFLFLEFEDEALNIKFNAKVEKFLQNLLGISLDELELASIQVGLSELRVKIKELKRSNIFYQENEKVIFEIFKDERIKNALEPSFGRSFTNNLAFWIESAHMGLKTPILYKGENAVMICVGSVYNDYEKFLNTLKEAS